MKLFVGTSGYAYPAWKGSFYPADLSAKKMLAYYAAHFSSVELNHTFYKIPSAAQLAASVALIPASFRFSLKVPMAISHRKEPSLELLAVFAERLDALGRHGGLLYWQIPPTSTLDLSRLRTMLTHLPAWRPTIHGGKELAIAIELAHPSWHVSAVRALLDAHQVGFVMVDALSEEGVVAPSKRWITSSAAYVRLRRADYTDAHLRAWVRRLQRAPIEEAYVYFKHEDSGLGPRFARRFEELWNT